MTTDTKPPVPIIAMQSDAAIIRQGLEMCADTLDSRPTTARVRQSVTLDPVTLPQGGVATIRCSRSVRTGDVTLSVRFHGVPK